MTEWSWIDISFSMRASDTFSESDAAGIPLCHADEVKALLIVLEDAQCFSHDLQLYSRELQRPGDRRAGGSLTTAHAIFAVGGESSVHSLLVRRLNVHTEDPIASYYRLAGKEFCLAL